MKKLVLVFFSLAVIFFIFRLPKQETPVQKEEIIVSETVTPTTTAANNSLDINFANNITRVSYFTIASSSALNLYPNFKEKLSADQARKMYTCRFLTSAGFYDKQNEPLGLFVSAGKTLQLNRPSNFFNGYFSLAFDNSFSVGRVPQDKQSRIALQSGPLLVEAGQPQVLKIIDDKPARRIVIGETKKGEIIFLVFFNKEEDLQGPNLADLPELLRKFSQLSGIELKSALNLDGGNASAFYNEEISLSELTSVGGFFCIL